MANLVLDAVSHLSELCTSSSHLLYIFSLFAASSINFNACIAICGCAVVATIPCLNGADKSIDAIKVLGIFITLENTSTAFSGEVLLAYICFNLLTVKSCLIFIS